MVSPTRVFSTVLIAGLFMLAGCMSGPQLTQLVDIKKPTTPPQKKRENILVVGKPIKEKNRNDFEHFFSKKLNTRNTKAVPSLELIPDMAMLNRENIKDAAVRMSADSVLATRVVGVDEKTAHVPQQMDVRIDNIPTHGGMGMTMTPFLQPPQTINYTNVRLETGLFDVETEEMLWGASSVIVAPDSAGEAIKDFSKAIILQLKDDGFLN